MRVRVSAPWETYVLGYRIFVRTSVSGSSIHTYETQDVFNRHLSWQSQDHVVHVMKYMFPRQFGLHNVFTSTVAWKESAHRAKDYTLREGEIAAMEQNLKEKPRGSKSIPHLLPKRLRGSVPRLVARLLKLHSRCSYAELLKHYCPSKVIYLVTQDAKTELAF